MYACIPELIDNTIAIPIMPMLAAKLVIIVLFNFDIKFLLDSLSAVKILIDEYFLLYFLLSPTLVLF